MEKRIGFNKKLGRNFRTTLIGGNEKSCPSMQSGKSKKTWRLFL
ncbi:MAG: hypothetical protein ABIH28_03060 [archaeon]